MKNNNEIVKKYSLYMKAKKLLIFFASLAAITFFIHTSIDKAEFKIISFLSLSISIISFIIFIIFWMGLRPMKKHILELIEGNKD